MGERAGGCERIPGAESDWKRPRKYLRAPITWTNARTCPNNIGPWAGWASGSILSFLRSREDEEGEYFHLVILWRATREEQKLYEEAS